MKPYLVTQQQLEDLSFDNRQPITMGPRTARVTVDGVTYEAQLEPVSA